MARKMLGSDNPKTHPDHCGKHDENGRCRAWGCRPVGFPLRRMERNICLNKDDDQSAMHLVEHNENEDCYFYGCLPKNDKVEECSESEEDIETLLEVFRISVKSAATATDETYAKFFREAADVAHNNIVEAWNRRTRES